MAETIGKAYLTVDRYTVGKCLRRSTLAVWCATCAWTATLLLAIISYNDPTHGNVEVLTKQVATLQGQVSDMRCRLAAVEGKASSNSARLDMLTSLYKAHDARLDGMDHCLDQCAAKRDDDFLDLSNRLNEIAVAADSNFSTVLGLYARQSVRLDDLSADFCKLYNYSHQTKAAKGIAPCLPRSNGWSRTGPTCWIRRRK